MVGFRCYPLQYQRKVLADLGIGFGIGPEPKLRFRSYTNCARSFDSLFEMWIQYQLQYQPKVLADLGIGFGIGPEPKLRFWVVHKLYTFL